jgi:hypothetical protein
LAIRGSFNALAALHVGDDFEMGELEINRLGDCKVALGALRLIEVCILYLLLVFEDIGGDVWVVTSILEVLYWLLAEGEINIVHFIAGLVRFSSFLSLLEVLIMDHSNLLLYFILLGISLALCALLGAIILAIWLFLNRETRRILVIVDSSMVSAEFLLLEERKIIIVCLH